MTTHVIVGCGKSKAPGELPARDKYDSSYFIVKREFAETIGDPPDDGEWEWSVYSAKFGLIRPNRIVDDYDVKASDVPDRILKKRVASTFDVIPEDTDKVVVCAGSDYVDPVRGLFERSKFDVDFYFDGTDGMFDQQSKMKKAVKEANNEDLNQYV